MQHRQWKLVRALLIVLLVSTCVKGTAVITRPCRYKQHHPYDGNICACLQVRDQLTSQQEQNTLRRQRGVLDSNTAKPKSDAVSVDAIVSTIGFPLVGGPAGTMEGGRQAEVAKAILQSKDVPYIVAAPLLIQARHCLLGMLCFYCLRGCVASFQEMHRHAVLQASAASCQLSWRMQTAMSI